MNIIETEIFVSSDGKHHKTELDTIKQNFNILKNTVLSIYNNEEVSSNNIRKILGEVLASYGLYSKPNIKYITNDGNEFNTKDKAKYYLSVTAIKEFKDSYGDLEDMTMLQEKLTDILNQ